MAKSSLSSDPLQPVMQSLIKNIATEDKKGPGKQIGMVFVDPLAAENEEKSPTLTKSILNVLDGGGKNTIERLAFESDPSLKNQYSSLYTRSSGSSPTPILKRISIQDDLVAGITNARSNHLSAFGRPRPDRFSLGFVIDPKAGVLDRCNDEQKKDLQDRIEKLTQKLSTCGETRGWGDNDRMTFAQYLAMSTRDAITVGRIATEVIYVIGTDGQKRPTASGPSTPAPSTRPRPRRGRPRTSASRPGPPRAGQEQEAHPREVRERRVRLGPGHRRQALQAFTSKECLVHNFYPVTHVELDGYPLTPLDTVISAVTTHINITTHNKLYFQTGRATRGMLVIQSDEMDESGHQPHPAAVQRQHQQREQRLAHAGVRRRQDDQITWSPSTRASATPSSSTSATATPGHPQRVPDEPGRAPGYAHLSRGTNNQALSRATTSTSSRPPGTWASSP
jgi:hypothetical protein